MYRLLPEVFLSDESSCSPAFELRGVPLMNLICYLFDWFLFCFVCVFCFVFVFVFDLETSFRRWICGTIGALWIGGRHVCGRQYI